MDFSKVLDKAYKDLPLSEVADAPVDALYGVSAADAQKLEAAFGIKTVRDLATNKYFLAAQAIVDEADDLEGETD